MTITLQISDVPTEVRDALAEQARREGRSVQSYLLALVEREARLLQNAAAFERTSALRVSIPPTSHLVGIIREGRERVNDIDPIRDDGFVADRADLS